MTRARISSDRLSRRTPGLAISASPATTGAPAVVTGAQIGNSTTGTDDPSHRSLLGHLRLYRHRSTGGMAEAAAAAAAAVGEGAGVRDTRPGA